jgi:hypothetical protein
MSAPSSDWAARRAEQARTASDAPMSSMSRPETRPAAEPLSIRPLLPKDLLVDAEYAVSPEEQTERAVGHYWKNSSTRPQFGAVESAVTDSRFVLTTALMSRVDSGSLHP